VAITEEARANNYTIETHPEHFFHLPQNVNRAVELFDKSASLGNSYAQYWLGYAYHTGTSVPKNMKRAIGYLQQAAKNKNGDAAYYLATMYKIGDGVSIDPQKWNEYFTLALELSNGNALYVMADACYHGKDGVPVNKSRAFDLYAKAAEQNHGDAWFCLGVMYYHGETVKQDFGKAYDCYANAASNGNLTSLEPMALMSLEGKGTVKDVKYAEHLYKVLKQIQTEQEEAAKQ